MVDIMIYIQLLTECIVFAQTVFSSSSSGLKGNEFCLEEIINKSNQHLDKLISEYTKIIINEMHCLRVQDSIQDLQARIVSLKHLLNYQEIDSNLAHQLVITALNPLNVSLEIVKLKLGDLEEQMGSEVYTLCYVTGISALIAGYKFLGQDIPSLQKKLEQEMQVAQKNILDEIAVIASKGDIPWENISYLMSPEGIEKLAELYETLLSKYSQEINHSRNCSNKFVNIRSAMYGTKDITLLLKEKIAISESDFICLLSNEELGGDPNPGSLKSLIITYDSGGKVYTQSYSEGVNLYIRTKFFAKS